MYEVLSYILLSHIIIVRVYQLMQFFNLKLSHMRYQVILFFLHVVMIHLGLCFIFLYCNWDLGVTIHLYQLNHFCNLKLTFLIYKLFHMSCVNLCQICRVFLFYHNHFIFITICMSFFYHQYILVYLFFYSMARKRT